MTSAEIKIAQRLVERRSLQPPINVEALVKEQATVIDIPIPFYGIDGLSINLKVRGKNPKVLVNTNQPRSRRRFTLAHELGHLLIPWHLGTFTDSVDLSDIESHSENFEFEKEANNFAAELLMPKNWVSEIMESESDLAHIHKIIATQCIVSGHAAAKKLISCVSADVVYAVERNGNVEVSERSAGSRQRSISWGSPLEDSLYPRAKAHYVSEYSGQRFHWWIFAEKIEGVIRPVLSWNDLLGIVFSDLDFPEEVQIHMRQSINGVFGALKGSLVQQKKFERSRLIAAALDRFHEGEKFEKIRLHPRFEEFVAAKAWDMAGR